MVEGYPEVYSDIPVSDLAWSINPNWERVLLSAIRDTAKVIPLRLGGNSISREDDFIGREFPTVISEGSDLLLAVPWLRDLYEGAFLEIVRDRTGKDASLEGVITGATANILGANMRFETHVDYYPVGGNFYLQEAPDRASGYLVVGDRSARTYNQVVTKPVTLVYPTPGTLTVVKLQQWPHTVSIVGDKDWRSPRNDEEYIDLLKGKAFEMPTLDDAFWKGARIGVNFNYTTPHGFDAAKTTPEQHYTYIHGAN